MCVLGGVLFRYIAKAGTAEGEAGSKAATSPWERLQVRLGWVVTQAGRGTRAPLPGHGESLETVGPGQPLGAPAGALEVCSAETVYGCRTRPFTPSSAPLHSRPSQPTPAHCLLAANRRAVVAPLVAAQAALRGRKGSADQIAVDGLTDAHLQQAATAMEGFSGEGGLLR